MKSTILSVPAVVTMIEHENAHEAEVGKPGCDTKGWIKDFYSDNTLTFMAPISEDGNVYGFSIQFGSDEDYQNAAKVLVNLDILS